MEEIKENEKNRILHRTLIPDQSGFKTSDAEMFKYDKYKGWYDEKGVYYNNLGIPSLIPKSQPPDSDRFKNNKLLEDGSGFELATGEIFFFTSVGGWYDEYKNYYGENGKPAKSPKYFEDVSSVDFSRFSKSETKDAGYVEEDADDENEQDGQLDNKEDLFSPNIQKNKEFKFEHKQNKAENKIEKLAQIISQYENFKLIKIFIDKISEKTNPNDLLEFVNKSFNNEIKIESINIVQSIIKHSKFSCIISLDKISALKFIHLQGKNFMDETLNLTIESINKEIKELSDDENDIVSSDHNLKEKINTKEKFKSGDEDIVLTYNKKKEKDSPKPFKRKYSKDVKN